MNVLGLLCSAYIVQRDSLFIHVLLREFLRFCIVLCICYEVTVWSVLICIIIIIINNTFRGLLLILFIISVTI